ncbi:hypothetical protein BOTBODRAFT_35260 [Botryobasidium botryosum FD-172 SS1]|uniref:TauD/TfdA-like domain-containing protein n=1 Tax=Botryobasidium botryosum (strain FD-172 SS1) TaxID=930990 RepID=A0A067MA66_BOTB1|nr:hypothetical protein BOTBODRAFT_35260 [Botryobasidium botryosum FD-172 SS1]
MAPPTATSTEAQTPSATLKDTQKQTKPEPVDSEPYRYEHLRPVFTQDKYPPLTPFTHVDPGHRALALPDPRALFKGPDVRVTELTPVLGNEVYGINLAKLDAEGRDQVALEVARRGVVVFRDQPDFLELGAEGWREWGRYFGRLHIHPTSGHPAGIPEMHLVYKDADNTFNFELQDHVTSTSWHSDVSYELQPPGLTTFFLLSTPATGGDTLFVSQIATLKHLSAPFVEFLRTLKAVHSGVPQAEYSRAGRRGGTVRREPVENVHPVVRRHPVTGEEALYVNAQFTKKIVGLKREESDTILKFLYDHVAKNADSQLRVKWSPNTVVLWDNRVTTHTAIVDYTNSGERRHGARITPQAERPIPALETLDLGVNKLENWHEVWA